MKALGFGVAAAVSSMVIAAAAWGGALPAAASATTAPAVPQSGGTATLITDTAPTSFDPISVGVGGITQSSIQLAIYDDLIHVASDGTITPDLALSVTSPDSLTWTITLRPNLVFSDGTPLDAQALIFNFQRDAIGPPGNADAKNIVSMVATSSTVMTLTLNAPESTFPFSLQDSLGAIASPTAVRVEAGTYATRPVGAGPFMLQSSVPGASYTLVKNPKYFGAPTLPYLNSITISIIPDPTSAYNAFSTGTGDIIYFPTPDPQSAKLAKSGYKTTAPPLFGGGGAIFNTTKAPFNDPTMRLAFVEATNVRQLDAKWSAGAAKPITTLFPRGSVYFNAKIVQKTNKAAAAQRLITTYVKKSGPIAVSLLATPATDAMFTALAAQWNKLQGVSANVVEVSPGQEAAALGAKNFQVAAASAQAQDPALLNLASFSTPGAANFGGFSNSTFDAAAPKPLSLGLSAVKPRKAAYNVETQVLLQASSGIPWLWLYQAQVAYYAQPFIRGVAQWGPGYLNWPQIWTTKA
jgi:peptide/nickel transport system substrate-binding protein